MRRVEIFLTIFFSLALLPGRVYAQAGADGYLVVDRLSRENGLPDQDINGLYFDSKGYAWISTFGGGLVRYDGDSFMRFSKKTDPESVGDIASQCCEDYFGRLWIPDAGSMNLLDLQSLAPVSDFPGISKAWLHAHPSGFVTKDAKGNIWFTSDDKLFRVAFADNGNRFMVDSLRCYVSNDNLMPKACDVESDGSVWITLNGHFFKVRQIEGRGLCLSEMLPGINIGDDNTATAYLRLGNDVWVGTQRGLYKVDIVSGDYVCYLHSDTDSHSIPSNEITALCSTPENEIVIGTVGGLCIYNPVNHSFEIYGSRTPDEGHRILPGEIVRCLATRGRQIWVGLEAEGLVILQRKALQIANHPSIETTSSPIPPTPVRSLFIDSQDGLWLAATEFGLCREVGDLVFRNYTTANSSLLSNSVTTFCEDGQGRVWMGSVDGHLNYVNMASPDVIRVPEGSKSEVARNIDVILGIEYDRVNEYIWIMARSGLYYYDIGKSSFAEYPVDLPTCLTSCIVSDKLWVSTTAGMCIIDLKTLESRMMTEFPVCMSLILDGDVVWGGTYGYGLYRVGKCTSEKPDITVFTESDGLADSQINGLLRDGIYLWITTEYGLSRLDTQTGEMTSYDLDDGLKSMAFCENSIAKRNDGTIFLGLKGGGFSLLRTSFVPNEYGNKPEVVISGYYSGDKFHSLSHADVVSKDEKDTGFTLKFSDLSYSKGVEIFYESRIWPLEKNWSPIFENDTHVKFGHIPGGKYRIQIRAVDKSGNVLSQDEKVLEVRPAFYKRWWFLLLVLLLLAQIVYGLVKWNTKAINRKKNLLQEEVDRQTIELKRKAEELSEQNALLQRQNEMIASHNTLLSSTMPSRESEFSSKLLETIQKMYKDPNLDVPELAGAMGLSRGMLNEKIQNTLGLSTVQFIRTYRLNVAKEMICNGTNDDMNISEIAYEVGFNDPKYFTKCFTKEFDATPSELHKKGAAR